MKARNKRIGVIAAAAAIGALVFGVASPGLADPAGGTFKPIVGVGSDTTQDVVGGLASVIPEIGRYNAGGGTIQVSDGGPTFNRPNGSTAGVQALSASVNDTGTRTWPASGGVSITGQIDFARSSSAPSGSFPGTQLTFIPFARDAVTFAVNAASDFPRDIPLGSSAQDSISPAPFTLRNIYRCTVTTYLDEDLNPVTIRPLIPQSGSGTRSFWIGALGLTEGTLGGCVTDLGNTVQEHSGAQVTGPGDIVPFSIAQYIAQGNYSTLPTTVAERRFQVELGRIGTVKPVIPSVGGGVELNGNFPVSRLVFNVVETARITEGDPKYDAQLAAAFVGTGSDVCQASSTIVQYGFGTIGALCGNTTTYKQGFRY
ncbi:MAG: substrate-binding domain-containing protein [Microcella sp.]